jgi:hypothetical protein
MAQLGLILIAPLLPHLQDVLRSWYARLPAVVQNAHALVQQTEECIEAFHQGEVLLLPEIRSSGVSALSFVGLRGQELLQVWHKLQIVGCWGSSVISLIYLDRVSGQNLPHEKGPPAPPTGRGGGDAPPCV